MLVGAKHAQPSPIFNRWLSWLDFYIKSILLKLRWSLTIRWQKFRVRFFPILLYSLLVKNARNYCETMSMEFWQVLFYFSNCYKKSYRFRNRSIFLVKCFLLIKLLQKILSDRNSANNFGWNISFSEKIRIFLFIVLISKIQNENKCDYFPLNEIILTMKTSININSLIDEIVNEKIFGKI